MPVIVSEIYEGDGLIYVHANTIGAFAECYSGN
jgi:hypothetical protein